MILLSHPTGNANSRQNALALEEAHFLEEFWTCIAWREDLAIAKIIPGSLRRELERRSFKLIPPESVHARPWLELARLIASRLGLPALTRHESGPFCVDAVYRDLDRHVASGLKGKTALTAVMASEDGAESTFRAARALGLRRIYELPIGYWRAGQKIYEEEALLEPEWAATLTGRNDSEQKLKRKDEELALATEVLVASQFTKQTLALAPEKPNSIHVIPYGCPSVASGAAPRSPTASRRLKVLFVGSLSQRKGLSYLFKAVEQLRHQVELTLIGTKTSAPCPALEAALRPHRWISSLPHAAVLQEMSEHDVLVFPSLFEGFGLVITEALSQGLPIISTPHTAGPDILSEGVDGFVIPIRSTAGIVEKLELLVADPTLLAAMKEAALCKARAHTWENYRATLRNALCSTPLPA